MVTVYVTNTNTGACEEIHCRTAATAEIVVAQLSQVPARRLRVDPTPEISAVDPAGEPAADPAAADKPATEPRH